MITNLLLKRLLFLWVLAFSASVWGQTYTLDLAAQSSAFGTSSTYEAKSGTVSGVKWYTNAASSQSTANVWLGTNNATNRTNLTKLSLGVNNRGGAIATALGIAATDVGYYAIVGANAIDNVASIKVKASATGGTAPETLWCLYTTDGGTTYTVLDSKTSPGTAEQTFTLTSTIASAQYAFVLYSSTFGTYRTPSFKFYAPTCTTSVFSFDSASINKVTGDASFTNTFTTNNTSPTAYSSTNTGVATVNASSGEVTINGAGTTTISVTQIADGTHCAVSSSYTLNVSSSTPLLNITGIANNGTVCTNSSAGGVTYTITNSGASAADEISVTSSDPQFVVSDISSTSIPANGTAMFKVTFTPTSAGDKSSTITVMSTTAGSNTATFGLTGKGLNTPPTATTPTSTAITASTATLGGNITIQGCSPITERGIYYSTINNFAMGTGTKVSEEGSFTTGVFTVNASGLNSSTTYYYKAFATSESGTAYSTQGTFITTAIAAPVATAATDIAETGFTANWEAVPGATGYELDVFNKVIGTSPNLVVNPGFEGSNLNDWSFESGMNQVISTSQVKTGTSSLYSTVLATKNLNQAIDVEVGKEYKLKFSYYIDQASTGNGFRVWTTTGATIQLPNASAYFNTKGSWVDVEQTFTATSSILVFNLRLYNGVKIYFDDFELLKTSPSVTENYVSGYNPKTIIDGFTVISDVTGLNSGTKYYYRVRAKDATSESVNSNVIDVTTLGSITWSDSGWSNEIGPDAAKNAVIDYDYTGTAFEAKSVKVNSGKTLTINSSVTTGDVTNNGAIILNDGASFIQSSTGLYDGSGTFKVNRNTESEAGKYAFWSSPVVNQDMYGIFPTAPEYVMTYNTGSNYYDIVTGAANASKGIGYSISTPSPAPGAAAFLGAPNNGTFNTTLALDSYKFNLVGNPYPSNLDLTKLLSANSDNIESTIWFWDNKSGPVKTQNGTTAASNGYATFNAAGTGVWVPATSVTASEIKSGVTAKIGQGFIVKAKSSALLFNNDMRTADGGSNFNKSTGNADEGKYWLTLTTPYNTKITQAITYQNGGSDRYDDYDSKARSNGSDAFYSLAGAEKVIIQGKAPFNADDIVVLGNKHFENGNFKIELTKTEGLFAEGQAIYLKDKVTGTETNLQEGTYLFSSNAGDFTDRFEVVYSKTVLGTNAAAKSTLAVYRNGDDFVIDSPSKIAAVEVYDASGKLMKSIKSNGNKETVSNLSRGVYILKITTATETVSKKIIK